LRRHTGAPVGCHHGTGRSVIAGNQTSMDNPPPGRCCTFDLSGIDTHSPQFLAASQACQSWARNAKG
jgi:hypothetical protein